MSHGFFFMVFVNHTHMLPPGMVENSAWLLGLKKDSAESLTSFYTWNGVCSICYCLRQQYILGQPCLACLNPVPQQVV